MILNLIAGVLCSLAMSLERPVKKSGELFPPKAPQSCMALVQQLLN